MKRIVSLIVTLMLMLSFGAVSVFAEPKLNASTYNLTLGYQVTLKVTGNTGAVQWGSSDTSVATVSDGKVIGRKIGTATISAVTDGRTLRCNVNVVATKITADKSAVTVDKGSYTTVTLTVTGDKSGLTLSSADSSIAKGSWSGAKWDGNKITFRVTANSPGTTSVTVYRKNYRSSYYKTVDITVPGAATPPPNTVQVVTESKTFNVAVGKSDKVAVYTNSPNALAVSSQRPDVASATLTADTAKNTATYKVFNVDVRGLMQGTTTVRVYDRENSSAYTDVTVTVTGTAYYDIVQSRPTPTGTDRVLTFQKNNSIYYMIVPNVYDEAEANSIISEYFRIYDYYTVYKNYPSLKATGDEVLSFYFDAASGAYSENTPYNPYYLNPNIAGNSYVRYVLVPDDYDEPSYDTAIAKYTGNYEYYTIYNTRPTNRVAGDTIENWQIRSKDGTAINRYMLLPRNFDADRAESIKEDDLEENENYNYYTVLDKFPANPGTGNEIFSWVNTKKGAARYMIVPKQNCDYVRRNDAIYADTGEYCYFNAYSTSPVVSAANAKKESIVSVYMQSGESSKMVYILVDRTDPNYNTKLQNIQSGDYYYTPQGDFYGNSPQY